MDLADPWDLERILLVWKHTVQAMRNGAGVFGDRAVCLRDEDTSTNARQTMEDLHDRLGVAPDPDVLDGYVATVRAPGPPPFADDPRWQRAFDRVGLTDVLEPFGYS